MPNNPFTPENFQQKISEVYALSDPALLIEATAVKNDVVQWINNNFLLTTEQETFLNGQNEFVLNNIGASAAICFINRLDIFLKMTPPDTNLSKFLKDENTLSITSNPDGTFTATGSLIIITGYA